MILWRARALSPGTSFRPRFLLQSASGSSDGSGCPGAIWLAFDQEQILHSARSRSPIAAPQCGVAATKSKPWAAFISRQTASLRLASITISGLNHLRN
jgi:hypothetical protein